VIGVLVSGEGTNLQALIDASDIDQLLITGTR
jgi:folate-dependent phosphoribosylglycinamide formyltransferase PurN